MFKAICSREKCCAMLFNGYHKQVRTGSDINAGKTKIAVNNVVHAVEKRYKLSNSFEGEHQTS